MEPGGTVTSYCVFFLFVGERVCGNRELPGELLKRTKVPGRSSPSLNHELIAFFRLMAASVEKCSWPTAITQDLMQS